MSRMEHRLSIALLVLLPIAAVSLAEELEGTAVTAENPPVELETPVHEPPGVAPSNSRPITAAALNAMAPEQTGLGRFQRRLWKEHGMSVAKPGYTSYGDAANYIAHGGQGTDGVVAILINIPNVETRLCTGVLLPTRRHVLTAAHCFTNDNGVVYTDATANVRFNIPGTAQTITATGFTTHPTFTASGGNLDLGGDLAVVRLGNAPSPPQAEVRHIHRTGWRGRHGWATNWIRLGGHW